MARSMAHYCKCGHPIGKHWRRHVVGTFGHDTGHTFCLTCCCSQYEHNGKARGNHDWAKRTVYPRRKDMF